MSSYLKIINYYLKFKPENTELQGSSVFPTFLHLLLPWFLGADHVVVVVRKQFSVYSPTTLRLEVLAHIWPN